MSTEPGFLTQVVEWFSDPLNWEGSFGIPARVTEHVIMSAVSVALAAVVALPAGLYIGHRRRFEFLVVSILNFGRAIPSFGLLFLFVLLFGIGLAYPASIRPPIIFALVLLAIPPILTSTYIGIQSVDPDTVEAARGMGMSEWEVLRRLELPLGAPLVLAGIRTAAVQVVATATLGAVVAGGGLGRFIVDGFATRDFAQIFGGALLVALMAVLAELGFGVIERLVTPKTRSRGETRRRRSPVGPPEDAARPLVGP